MSDFKVPLIIRGEVIEDYEVEHRDGGLGRSFLTPNVANYVDRMVAKSAAALFDLYTISFGEICDYLGELGERLDLDKNPHWREAFEVSCHASNISRSVLEAVYRNSRAALDPAHVYEVAEVRIGIPFLEGWVRTRLADGRAIDVRAMGSRSAHVIAGNVPFTAVGTTMRCALTRNDAIVKVPSNDPLTMVAIARTMIDMAPSHPITRHLTVGYWKGGDLAVEEVLYKPHHIEKIVAWGGLASVKHVTRYIQPGLELIALDPKRSATIIGREAFDDDDTMREVARRAATDIGVANQEGCANARVIYVLSGTDADGLANANRLGELIYRELTSLPAVVSTPPRYPNRELLDHLESSRMNDDFYRVIGGEQREGAIVVSQLDEPVDYSPMLSGRVANIVPVDSIDKVTAAVNAYTQTIGIYPESLKRRLRDTLALFGAQRLTSLGYACNVAIAAPQDAIEPIRRMCKWVVDEECEASLVIPLWKLAPA